MKYKANYLNLKPNEKDNIDLICYCPICGFQNHIWANGNRTGWTCQHYLIAHKDHVSFMDYPKEAKHIISDSIKNLISKQNVQEVN